MTITITLQSPIRRSFRTAQVAGLFDLPDEERSRQTLTAEVPGLDEPWQIGAIVGPSGSGKITLARAAFGAAVHRALPWDAERAVVDHFGRRPIRETIAALTAVGFSSPPAWLRPYHTLSTGEQFRCDLARSLIGAASPERKRRESEPAAQAALPGKSGSLQAQTPVANAPGSQTLVADARGSLLVYDEFTSTVDRTTAQVASAAVARYLRSGRGPARFVAVTCHTDILPWLAPDWTLDLATGALARGSLRRPRVELEVVACRPTAWTAFSRHHYLSGTLPRAARCWLAVWREEPVAFAATIGLFGRRGRKRLARLVVRPECQGLGIGPRFAEHVGQLERARGFGMNLVTSHPGLIGHCRRSERWRLVSVSPLGRRPPQLADGSYRHGSLGRGVVSFEFIPEISEPRASATGVCEPGALATGGVVSS